MSAASAPLTKPLSFLGALILSALLVFGLFWLLNALIATTSSVNMNTETLPTVDFVRLNKNFELETRERKPPPAMPDKAEAPPELPQTQVSVDAPTGNTVNIGPMKVDKEVAKNTGFALSASDGEYLPIVKVSPIYPARAQSQGIEGYVLLEFTVTETGSVVEPIVIEAKPEGVFNEAAKKAVLKFKYKPRVENGKPTRVPGVKQIITFKLEKK